MDNDYRAALHACIYERDINERLIELHKLEVKFTRPLFKMLFLEDGSFPTSLESASIIRCLQTIT